MTNNVDFEKTVDEIFGYFDQLDNIPLTVIKQYLKRNHGLKVADRSEPTSGKPSVKIAEGYEDTLTYKDEVYVFPKWYGYDKNNKVRFILDQRGERAGWWKTRKETSSAFEELFEEMQKRGLIQKQAPKTSELN